MVMMVMMMIFLLKNDDGDCNYTDSGSGDVSKDDDS